MTDDLESYFSHRDCKENKRLRKILSTKDRSKYKKSNLNQLQKRSAVYNTKKNESSSALKGRVLSIKGQETIVDSNGKIYFCVLRGLLKRNRVRLKNLLTVGDIVLFEPSCEDEGAIEHVEKRYSTLSRAENLSRNQEQIIASNIDIVLITSSIDSPPFKPNIIDRYIIATKKGNMTPIIVINKIDLIQKSPPEEITLYKEFLSTFAKTDISVISVSSKTGDGIEQLNNIIKNKASVFAGQSGVGKSSLINAITGLELETGNIVAKTKKGKHTTSTTNLIPLKCGGWCIDTPGIKSFGVWQLEKEEIAQYFPDIYHYGKKCKFPDCTHFHEPECSVQDALEKGLIPKFRFDSYEALFNSVSQEHRRR